jgi:DNA-binding MarR family transcriptional regulator
VSKLTRKRQDELDAVAELRVALRRFAAATDEVTRAHDLTPAQYDLLALLHRRRGVVETTATEIAAHLSLSRSATTELLTRAANAGLVTRRDHPGDMRVKPLAPTAEGTARFLAAVDDLRSERKRLLDLPVAAANLAAALNSSF